MRFNPFGKRNHPEIQNDSDQRRHHPLPFGCRQIDSSNADGRIRDTWLPIPASWFGVRETVQKSIDHALQTIVHQRFSKSLIPNIDHFERTDETNGVSLKDSTSPPTESRRFDDQRLTKFLEMGFDVSQQAAIEAGLIDVEPENGQSVVSPNTRGNSTAIHLDRNMLADQLQADDLKLFGGGGAKRTLLLLPSGVSTPESIEEWKQSLSQSITVVELDGLTSAILCVDGEQLELNQLVYRLWLPSRERCQLAERLHSRNDIEWLPIE